MADRGDESGSEEEYDDSLKNQAVVTKYKTCGEIVQKALNKVISECAPGKLIVDLCKLGDDTIVELTKSVYKGQIERGVAFPTSISVDNCVGHNSPLASEGAALAEGQVVKIDLGAHIDGIAVVAAHTVVINSTENPVSGRAADAICAAHFAAEAALRLIRPGNKNTDVTKAIEKIAESFKCNPVEGVLSHQLKRFVIDGNKVIINKQTPEQRVDEFTFEENEVYGIDIVISTGEGKPKETELRPTVYKRSVDQAYSLKMDASRKLLADINKRFPTFPFTLRAFDDEKKSKLGIVECVKHGLVYPFPVLFEKQGEVVAQFKFTALLLPGGTQKLTYFDLPHVSSALSIADPEILAVLGSSTKNKKKKKKNKKAGEEPKAEGAAKVGGIGNEAPVTEEVVKLVEQVKAEIQTKAGKQYTTFTPVRFATQTVAGTNFFVKINVGDEHIHARIFRDLKQALSVHSVQAGKKADDAIAYF